MNWLEDIELRGSIVTLEPLNMDHVEPLQTAVKDGEFWKLWYARVPAPEQMVVPFGKQTQIPPDMLRPSR